VRKLSLVDVHVQLLDAKWSTQEVRAAHAVVVAAADEINSAKKCVKAERAAQRRQPQQQAVTSRARLVRQCTPVEARASRGNKSSGSDSKDESGSDEVESGASSEGS